MPFNTRSSWDILLSIIMMFVMLAGVGWMLWRTLKRTEDPPRLLFKWMLTAVGLVLLFRLSRGLAAAVGGGADIGGAFFYAISAAILGLFFAIIWRHNITMMIAKPFGSLYDGGTEEAEPKPAYSSALAKRKRGDFLGAKADVRTQLQRFPNDFEGQMLLAEIEAQDINDVAAAGVVVERLLAQKGHAPVNLAYALNSLADWQLKYTQDIDAARASFERIGQLLPASEWALRAQQRIAHLSSRAMLNEANERRKYKVTHIEGDPGLETGWIASAPADLPPEDLAAQYVRHLGEFPHDTEIREKLARLYAEHYQRLDLAQDQLEQLIQFPNQPGKQVVRWLNQLADLQVQLGASYEIVRTTLQRVIDLYPEAGSAHLAQNRLELLRLEFKGKEKSQAVTLGSYEDDLGLKGRLPHQL